MENAFVLLMASRVHNNNKVLLMACMLYEQRKHHLLYLMIPCVINLSEEMISKISACSFSKRTLNVTSSITSIFIHGTVRVLHLTTTQTLTSLSEQ